MKPTCYRQGDVFIIPIEAIPTTGARKSHGRILAMGEATGHAHKLGNSERGEVCTIDGEMYLDIIDDAEIVHEEHGTITLPRGAYAVRIQREYTPAGIRRVYD